MTQPEPDFAASIARVIADEADAGAACGWQSCSGCHETNEGAETGYYPFSALFGCHVGAGCTECGGLGVVWTYWPKDALDAMAAETSPAPAMRPTHRHKQRGSDYALIGIGKMQAEDWHTIRLDGRAGGSVDMEEVAIYRSVDDGSLWARPREEFEDGRFVTLNEQGQPETEGTGQEFSP